MKNSWPILCFIFLITNIRSTAQQSNISLLNKFCKPEKLYKKLIVLHKKCKEAQLEFPKSSYFNENMLYSFIEDESKTIFFEKNLFIGNVIEFTFVKNLNQQSLFEIHELIEETIQILLNTPELQNILSDRLENYHINKFLQTLEQNLITEDTYNLKRFLSLDSERKRKDFAKKNFAALLGILQKYFTFTNKFQDICSGLNSDITIVDQYLIDNYIYLQYYNPWIYCKDQKLFKKIGYPAEIKLYNTHEKEAIKNHNYEFMKQDCRIIPENRVQKLFYETLCCSSPLSIEKFKEDSKKVYRNIKNIFIPWKNQLNLINSSDLVTTLFSLWEISVLNGYTLDNFDTSLLGVCGSCKNIQKLPSDSWVLIGYTHDLMMAHFQFLSKTKNLKMLFDKNQHHKMDMRLFDSSYNIFLDDLQSIKDNLSQDKTEIQKNFQNIKQKKLNAQMMELAYSYTKRVLRANYEILNLIHRLLYSYVSDWGQFLDKRAPKSAQSTKKIINLKLNIFKSEMSQESHACEILWPSFQKRKSLMSLDEIVNLCRSITRFCESVEFCDLKRRSENHKLSSLNGSKPPLVIFTKELYNKVCLTLAHINSSIVYRGKNLKFPRPSKDLIKEFESEIDKMRESLTKVFTNMLIEIDMDSESIRIAADIIPLFERIRNSLFLLRYLRENMRA